MARTTERASTSRRHAAQGSRAWREIPPQPDITLKEAVEDDLSFTFYEVAQHLRCTAHQVERWVMSGKLDAFTLPGGRGRRVRAVDVREARKEGLRTSSR